MRAGLVVIALVASGALLAGCGEPAASAKSDTEAIAGDAIDAAAKAALEAKRSADEVEDLTARVARLEGRVEQLEAQSR